MKTIWKYQLKTTDYQELLLPAGADVLSVGAQDATICIWVLLETEAPAHSPRSIWIRGTGQPVGRALTKGQFLGRVTLLGGLEFHIFMEPR